MTDEDKLGFTYEVLDRYIRTGEIEDIKTKERIDMLTNVTVQATLIWIVLSMRGGSCTPWHNYYRLINIVSEAAHENEPRLAVPSCHGRQNL